MIKLLDILFEDTGATGKQFEKIFKNSLMLVGLGFESNRGSGALWDIRPTTGDWTKLLNNAYVNIKISRTKWMWGSAELGRILPWDDKDENWNEDKYKNKVKRIINKAVKDIIFLKPASNDIESSIIKFTAEKNVEELNKLFTKANFYAEKLGSSYDIRILSRGNRITSIVIDKGGKPFMRSERPRKMGGSANFVAFRSDTAKIGNTARKVKQT